MRSVNFRQGYYLTDLRGPENGLIVVVTREVLKGICATEQADVRFEALKKGDLTALAILHLIHDDERIASSDPLGHVRPLE
jgi:hypothetical protein